VILPRLQQIYEWSARELAAPGLNCITIRDRTTSGILTSAALIALVADERVT
jgi:hypothetical protein